jgi:Amt family ammonium transporter
MNTLSLKAQKNYWLIPFLLLFAAGIAGAFFPTSSAPADTSNINSGDMAWMLTASALVLLMTPGLSFFYGGMVQPKNVISTMLQSFIALGVISLLWYVVGFSLSFGDSYKGLIGNPFTFMFFRGVGVSTHPGLSPTIPLLLFAAFQLKFAVITPALITGAFAERVRFSAYLLFIALFSLVIYCPLAHWTWHPDGFLRKMGVLDFAGGTVVHISAAFAALAGAMILGRRKVHVYNEVPPATNVPYVLLGTGMLWFGWFGFNAGSALAANGLAGIAFLTTHFASASAMLTWIFFDAICGRKPSALGACIGAVVGLVAITPAAGFVDFGPSILIGFVASVVSNIAVHWKNTKSTIDDTLDVFPCHGMGGIVGMIATGIFAKEVGLIHGDSTVFVNHLLALVIVSVFTFGGSFILYKIVNAIIPMRVRVDQEEVGLDISQHNESVFENGEQEKVDAKVNDMIYAE